MTSAEIANILIAVVAGVFSVLGVIAPIMVSKYVADASARASLSTAIQNALGAIQQSITPGIKAPGSVMAPPGVKPELLAGVEYVHAHVPAAVARFNLTSAQISDKIDAQIGLRKLAIAEQPKNLVVAARTPDTIPADIAPLTPPFQSAFNVADAALKKAEAEITKSPSPRFRS